jgi:hypothetical protein
MGPLLSSTQNSQALFKEQFQSEPLPKEGQLPAISQETPAAPGSPKKIKELKQKESSFTSNIAKGALAATTGVIAALGSLYLFRRISPAPSGGGDILTAIALLSFAFIGKSLIRGCCNVTCKSVESGIKKIGFDDPQWVKDKFELAVANNFRKLHRPPDLLDHLFKNNELAEMVDKIFDSEYPTEEDPRNNHTNFLTNLRAVLDSEIFKTELTKRNPKTKQPLNPLVKAVLEMCRIRFEEGHFYEFFNDTLHSLGLEKEGKIVLSEDDFPILKNMNNEHKMCRFTENVQSLLGFLNINFDPHLKGNIPYLLGTLDIDGKLRKLLRIGSITMQGWYGKAQIIPEFKGYLESLRIEEKTHLYISLQNDQPKLMGTETIRNQAFKDLENEFKNFVCVILAQDSCFYKQIDENGNPRETQQADQFIDEFYAEMFGENTGFYFSKKLLEKPLFKDSIKLLLQHVHKVFFDGKKELDREDKLDFIEIFYAYLSIFLINVSNADNVNISCKDAIDRAGKTNSLLMQLLLIIANQSEDPLYQRIHQVLTHMPAMWVKGRPILHDRRDRLVTAFARMCGKIENIRSTSEIVIGDQPIKFAGVGEKVEKKRVLKDLQVQKIINESANDETNFGSSGQLLIQ